jgi:hypothetical protein
VDHVATSDLTLIECNRALVRGIVTGRLPEAGATDRRALLARVADHWTVLALDAEIAHRARQPFPVEPVRTLEAIHLAAALEARAMLPDLRVLSLDDRVRANARALGFEVVPD